MWTAVTALATFSIVDHAWNVAAEVRSRVIADTIALTAAVSLQHASRVATENLATVDAVTMTSDDTATTCVEVRVGGRSRRACAQLMTPTLDSR